MKDEFLAGWRHRDCFSEMLEGVDLGGLDRWQRSRLLWSRSALCNYILHTFWATAAGGYAVEGRLPFWTTCWLSVWRTMGRNGSSMKIGKNGCCGGDGATAA